MKNELWLYSDSVIKRSLSIVGHNIIGWIIIYISMFILIGIAGLFSKLF